MSFPLQTLRTLLGSKVVENTKLGLVVAASPTQVQVATPSGIKITQAEGIVGVGDVVSVENDIATKLQDIKTIVSV